MIRAGHCPPEHYSARVKGYLRAHVTNLKWSRKMAGLQMSVKRVIDETGASSIPTLVEVSA